MMRFVDMHCHLDLMANGPQVAADARGRGIALLNASVTPQGYRCARERYADAPAVRCAAGLHPWWVSDGSCGDDDVARLALDLASERFVGEVGLDLGTRHTHARARQEAAFERIVRACAENPLPGRVLTIHAVRSAGTVLDALERYDLTRSAACIFHWFSGTSEELARARRAGCLFSVNGMMLATRRGREYARIIPQKQLLLETDAPAEQGAPGAAADLEAALQATLSRLAQIRGVDEAGLGRAVAERGAELLGL